MTAAPSSSARHSSGPPSQNAALPSGRTTSAGPPPIAPSRTASSAEVPAGGAGPRASTALAKVACARRSPGNAKDGDSDHTGRRSTSSAPSPVTGDPSARDPSPASSPASSITSGSRPRHAASSSSSPPLARTQPAQGAGGSWPGATSTLRPSTGPSDEPTPSGPAGAAERGAPDEGAAAGRAPLVGAAHPAGTGGSPAPRALARSQQLRTSAARAWAEPQ